MPASDEAIALGIDLGGTDIKSVILTATGREIARRSVPTRAREGRDAVVERIVALAGWAHGELGETRLSAVGVAVPGVIDVDEGRVELLTNLTPEWHGYPLRDVLSERIGVPVALQNDVRAATFGEKVFGAGKPYSDFICIAIGTGVGGGLVLNNQLYMGGRGAAGEIGHVTIDPNGPRCNCGNLGCLEVFTSGPALTRAAKRAIEDGDDDLAALASSNAPSPHQLADAAHQGNESARAIFHKAGRDIGLVAADLVVVLNPQAVIIGGGVAKAGELLLQPIRAEIARRTVVFTQERGGVDVLLSPLGGNAGAIGAAAWAMRAGT